MSERILIADDDPIQRQLLEGLCNRFGYEAETVAGGEAALARLRSQNALPVSLLILDLVMPGLDGMAVLARLKEAGETLPIIATVSQSSVDAAISAIRAGAADFVVKPAGAERLQASIKNALHAARLAENLRFFSRQASGTFRFADLASESAEMARAASQGERAAKSTIPVLLEGEPGTGKEVFARAIHGASPRKGRAFVAVNCAALPEAGGEEVLFGGADAGRGGGPGKFAAAHGGTLFLGQICELPLDAQAKLLRALSEGLVHPAGARRPVKADVRLVSAASRDLIELVKLGQFREDLYYRINVFPVAIPPLRARREDIARLASFFCTKFAAGEGRLLRGICAEAQALLAAYDWPGNVRQLENAVFRAVALAEGGELTVADFPQIAARVEGFGVRVPPAPLAAPKQAGPAKEFVRVEVRDPNALPLLDACGDTRSLGQLEAEAIKFALSHYRGQMSSVARKLGIGRSTLYRKLKQHGLAQQEELEPVYEESAPRAARA
ncbi:MAG: sigma-54 dependent transcriptional regulator [Beijerinckiaceae bacterium]|nr:sigma-54 dependent transcriptional regulator [Beijerinckiaceae bacterium]